MYLDHCLHFLYSFYKKKVQTGFRSRRFYQPTEATVTKAGTEDKSNPVTLDSIAVDGILETYYTGEEVIAELLYKK